MHRCLLWCGYAGSSLEVKTEADSNYAVEIKTEADSNVTDCSHDGGSSIGMFGFVTFTCPCVICILGILCYLHSFASF